MNSNDIEQVLYKMSLQELEEICNKISLQELEEKAFNNLTLMEEFIDFMRVQKP